MDAHTSRPDGTQTGGTKGIPYDWQSLLVPDEPGFTAGISGLLDGEFAGDHA